MPVDHPTEEDLVMLYYREILPELRAHLESCEPCRTAYQNLARVLDACDDLPDRRRVSFNHRRERRRDGIAGERAPSGDHLIQYRSIREDVRAGIDRAPLNLLRRHISRGADKSGKMG